MTFRRFRRSRSRVRRADSRRQTTSSLPAAQGEPVSTASASRSVPGEILGLYGLMGAGRTEVLESVLGVHADARGSVRLEGHELAGLEVRERIARGIAMVPEDRQASGLVQR